MAKGFLKKVFDFVFDTRDPDTIVDDFAKAAFKREGYEVQKRKNVQGFDGGMHFLGAKKITYALTKEGKEYTGSVTTGLVSYTSAMHGHCAAGVVPYHSLNNDIKPKM